MADGSTAILLNGVLESQLDIVASAGRYLIGNSRHPFIFPAAGGAAFPLVGLAGLVQ